MDMKRSRFTEEQIIGILKEQESGGKTADVCRRHGISEATFQKSGDARPLAAGVTTFLN
jgi:transposase-like protein